MKFRFLGLIAVFTVLLANTSFAQEVSIAGLDRAEVIIALYNGAQAKGFGCLIADKKQLDKNEAKSLVGKYIDYLHGRVMKIEVSKDYNFIDTYLYDRDNGEGTAKAIIQDLRKGVGIENSEESDDKQISEEEISEEEISEEEIWEKELDNLMR